MPPILKSLYEINQLFTSAPGPDVYHQAECCILPCCDVINGETHLYHDDDTFSKIACEAITDLMKAQLKVIVSVNWVSRDENQLADWIAGRVQ